MEDSKPVAFTREHAAAMLDLPLLAPVLTEAQVQKGFVEARAARIASVLVRPCDADLAVRMLQGSSVVVGSVVNAPHGLSNTAAKLYEGRDLLRRGVKELEFHLNVARMIGRSFPAMETELLQIAESCAENAAELKIVFEPALFPLDLRLIALKLCRRVGAGFAVIEGSYSAADLAELRQHAGERLRLKAGAVATWDELAAARDAGCARVNVNDIETVLAGAPVIVS